MLREEIQMWARQMAIDGTWNMCLFTPQLLFELMLSIFKLKAVHLGLCRVYIRVFNSIFPNRRRNRACWSCWAEKQPKWTMCVFFIFFSLFPITYILQIILFFLHLNVFSSNRTKAIATTTNDQQLTHSYKYKKSCFAKIR